MSLSWIGRVRLTQGDIAAEQVEAIVNAASNELWMGSGVAGALKRAGGAVIEREAVAQGPISVGGAVLTSAGNLSALHVIHAAAMPAGRPATAESVQLATEAALELAAQHKIETVAFPALGAGAGGLDFGQCARAMFAAMREHYAQDAERPLPGEVRIVLYGANALELFRQALAELD